MTGILNILAGALGRVTDSLFEYVTLLLPGNGTNGAQNNTFLDGSTNNFTITRNGNTTQGTFSPFSQTGWGNYFGGSGNYLKVADGTALDLPGDFTLEGWFYFSSLSSNNGIIGYGSEAASQNGFSLYWAASTVNKLRIYSNGAALLTGTTTLSANTWNHIAVVRSGSGSNNLTVYVNGAVDQTATTTTSFTGVAALGMGIGINYDGTFYNPFTGYASNVRLVKGQALATGAFTPPTSPVTTSSVGWTGANAAASLTGTVSVLTCQSNRFVDNSASPLTITVTGSPSVQAFSPFNPTASWSAATYGGSGYFDGSGDYLSIADNAALDIGSSDFSIEAWVYITNLAGSSFQAVYAKRNALPGYTFGIKSTGVLFTWNGSTEVNTAGITLAEKTWYHLVWSSVSGTLRMFVNGTSYYSASYSISTNAYAPTIGAGAGASGGAIGDYLFGYVSGFKLVKGTGVTSVTVPTQPPTATGSNLLLNFTNAGIYDATSKNDLETVGNAQISTTQSKWGGSSMAFDGTGDYLINYGSNDLFAFGSGDWTIELWLYLSNVSGQKNIYDCNPSSTVGVYPNIYILNTTLYYFTNGSNRITAGTALSSGVWYHIAVSRSGTSTRLFLNGTQEGSTYTDSNVYLNGGSNRPIFGGSGYSVGTNLLNGYMQDLRVTKGYARYTANFTPPTAAFPTL